MNHNSTLYAALFIDPINGRRKERLNRNTNKKSYYAQLVHEYNLPYRFCYFSKIVRIIGFCNNLPVNYVSSDNERLLESFGYDIKSKRGTKVDEKRISKQASPSYDGIAGHNRTFIHTPYEPRYQVVIRSQYVYKIKSSTIYPSGLYGSLIFWDFIFVEITGEEPLI